MCVLWREPRALSQEMTDSTTQITWRAKKTNMQILVQIMNLPAAITEQKKGKTSNKMEDDNHTSHEEIRTQNYYGIFWRNSVFMVQINSVIQCPYK